MSLVAAVDLGKTSCRVRLVRDGDPIGRGLASELVLTSDAITSHAGAFAKGTGAMATGRSYGAWMVDVRASNHKLRPRAVRMLREATGVSDTAAHEALEAADWRPKTALVALLTGVDVGSAARALDAAGGRARVAVTQLGQRLDGAG